MSVNFVALALGQWLILVGDRLGFVPFAMVSVLFSFALLPITLTPVNQPAPVEAPSFSLRTLYLASPLGVAVAFASGLLNGTFYSMGALYAVGVGLSDTGVAAFMAATILGGAIFQWPVGHYSDSHDRRGVLVWVCLGAAALAGAAFVLPALNVGWLVGVGLLYGGLVFTVYGLGVAHVNDVIDSSRLLEFTSGLLLVHGVGAAVGPVLAGGVMDQFGASSLMVFFAVVLVSLALYTIKRMGAAPPVPEAAKADYVVMGSGSQAVLQMDPRDTSEGSPPAASPESPPAPPPHSV
jgi:MFS family permease